MQLDHGGVALGGGSRHGSGGGDVRGGRGGGSPHGCCVVSVHLTTLSCLL